ncbi:MAG: alpha/beta hydrolase [Prolixibacteraceae bacterium]|nr:alpha/beta hydrolase [Prolixibacteraceae bacterium]
MNSASDFKYPVKPSIESKLVQFFMALSGMKKSMEKKILNNTYSKEPAEIPKAFFKNFNVDVEKFRERKVWTISPKIDADNTAILFLHGGAYYANISKMHWLLVEKITNSTNSTLIVPDYPLAPESTYKETYQFLDAVYSGMISKFPSKQFIFMGDSSGGGLALGFAMKVKNETLKQPNEIMLFSPWLDVSMSNPEIDRYEKCDKMLNVKALKKAGRNYAGDTSITDYRISPIYGDFLGLGRITIFIGTNEVFIADARKLKQLLHDQNIGFNYFEYPGMFHDWVVVTNIKETDDVINEVVNLMCN